MAFQFPANPAVGQQFAPLVGLTYVWNGTGWTLIGVAPSSIYPPGFVSAYAGTGAMVGVNFQGWLLCDGKQYPTATYPDLFTVLGYTFGGAGLNFNVPDLRGRVIAGVDSMGGVAAGRLTPGAPRGAVSGAQDVTLALNQMPTHNHGFTDPGHTHVVNDPGHTHALTDPGHSHSFDSGANPLFGGSMTGATNTVATYPTTNEVTGIVVNPSPTAITNAANPTGITISDAGSSLPHLNVQPTMVLQYIIKT